MNFLMSWPSIHEDISLHTPFIFDYILLYLLPVFPIHCLSSVFYLKVWFHIVHWLSLWLSFCTCLINCYFHFYFYKICKMSVCTNLNNPCVQNGNSLSYCFYYCKPAVLGSLSGLQVWCLSSNLKHVRFESSWIQYFQDNGFREIRWCHLISS